MYHEESTLYQLYANHGQERSTASHVSSQVRFARQPCLCLQPIRPAPTPKNSPWPTSPTQNRWSQVSLAHPVSTQMSPQMYLSPQYAYKSFTDHDKWGQNFFTDDVRLIVLEKASSSFFSIHPTHLMRYFPSAMRPLLHRRPGGPRPPKWHRARPSWKLWCRTVPTRSLVS